MESDFLRRRTKDMNQAEVFSKELETAKKDATRWGVTNEDMENIFFVFCPPWIHSKPDLSKSLNGSRAVVDTSNELALDSGRVPFGPQSASGNCIQIHVRNLSYAFTT